MSTPRASERRTNAIFSPSGDQGEVAMASRVGGLLVSLRSPVPPLGLGCSSRRNAPPPVVAADRRIFGGQGALPAWGQASWIALRRLSPDFQVLVDVVRPNGHRRRSLGQGESPAWSPDGRFLAVSASCNPEGSSTTIYVMAPDGSGRRAVLPCPLPSGRARGRGVSPTTSTGG